MTWFRFGYSIQARHANSANIVASASCRLLRPCWYCLTSLDVTYLYTDASLHLLSPQKTEQKAGDAAAAGGEESGSGPSGDESDEGPSGSGSDEGYSDDDDGASDSGSGDDAGKGLASG